MILKNKKYIYYADHMEIYTQGFYNCLDFPSKKKDICTLVGIPFCACSIRDNK